MRLAVVFAALALVVAGAGCGGKSPRTASGPATTGRTTEQPAGACKRVQPPEARPTGGRKRPKELLAGDKTYDVILFTNCGAFTIRLDQTAAPHAAASFFALAGSGFFAGTIFHRIVPGFVIQGGDPTATGTGGPGYSTVDRPSTGWVYTKGVVAMAKTQAEPPGTAGSQFFVVTRNATLPPDFAVVGRVTKGLAVVLRIGRLGDSLERPTQAVVIQRALAKAS